MENHQALYRKYRPSFFREVIGQEHIKKTLLNEIVSQRISHAYLFCGPRGVGKTTLARLLAKGVNCLNPHEGEPCNECESCKMINKNSALDIIEIDAASHTGVDNVRDNIISNARIAPSILRNKVFIIDEVHMLSLSAFNALLKILEEPPKNIIFILATTEIHKVPETIISRCQRFDFKRVNLQEIVKKLEKIIQAEKIQIDLEVLQRIAKHSEGSARDAESLLGQILVLDNNHITSEMAELVLPRNNTVLLINFFKLLVAKQSKEAIDNISSLVEQGIDLEEFNNNYIEFLRQLLLYKVTGRLSELEYLDADQNTHQEIIIILKNLSVAEIVRMIKVFFSKNEDLKNSQIKQLPLELAIIEICEPPLLPVVASSSIVLEPPKKKLNLPITSKSPLQLSQKKEMLNETKNVPVNEESLKDIKNHWPAIIDALKKKNYSLAMLMSVVQLVSLDQKNTLYLGVKHQFHSSLICSKNNAHVIAEIISGQIGKPVKISCLVGDQYHNNMSLTNLEKSDNLQPVSDDDAANVWDLALNTFTGSEIKE